MTKITVITNDQDTAKFLLNQMLIRGYSCLRVDIKGEQRKMIFEKPVIHDKK